MNGPDRYWPTPQAVNSRSDPEELSEQTGENLKLQKKAAALFGATATLSAGLVMTGVGTAHAASDCSFTNTHNYSDKNYTFKSGKGELYNGPNTNCGGEVDVPISLHFYEWCAYQNSAGNIWIYGRLEGTSTMGWQWQGNLNTASGSAIPDVWCQ
ncbi:hypothetical protein [Actinoallomurus acaciae]|uniref:Secreted protein n=1 Tax=Actinoallomurus acaciae TaxID=502577 RepID=A0ABV5YJI8_9ACTN